jgi:hypothetical protein
MGLLSSIGKALGGIWKGIKTGFKSVLGAVGKALNSKLGKILMMAVSVFTLGTAFIAAQGAYAAASAAGQSFVGAFMEGGKAFVGSLIGKGAKDGAEAAGALGEGGGKVANVAEFGPRVEGLAGGVDATKAATTMGGALKPVAEAAAPLGSTAGTMQGIGGVLEQGQKALGAAGEMVSGGALPAAKAGVDAGGWLSKAAGAAMDFAKSDSGQKVIGSMLDGYAEADKMQQVKDIYMRGPNSFKEGSRGMQELAGHDFNVDVPNNLAYQAGGKAGGVVRGHTKRVPYQQQQGG